MRKEDIPEELRHIFIKHCTDDWCSFSNIIGTAFLYDHDRNVFMIIKPHCHLVPLEEVMEKMPAWAQTNMLFHLDKFLVSESK